MAAGGWLTLNLGINLDTFSHLKAWALRTAAQVLLSHSGSGSQEEEDALLVMHLSHPGQLLPAV